jgi:GDP-4-dehydro-6-deoxy-D-mannose reductase
VGRRGPPLITGSGGFVGHHLAARLTAAGHEPVTPSHAELELLDADAVRTAMRTVRPGTVFHLAALASVARSWHEPDEVLRSNVAMTENLLEAVDAEVPKAVVVLASSGEVYGAPESLPVTEDAPLRPLNPYAASKAACEQLATHYVETRGLGVIRLRPFNHAGPGQSDQYVIGSLTRQVAAAELAGADLATVCTGNPDSARDFTDVRDVVRAYEYAARLEPGAYNVCSGRAVPVSEIVELVGRFAGVPIQHEVDPERLRVGDVPEVRGSAELLHGATGWAPEIPLERTVSDALEHWRAQLPQRYSRMTRPPRGESS